MSIKNQVETRADLRGKPLDEDCKKAKISTNMYGIDDNRKFCYGLCDASTEEPLEKCNKCGAFESNAEPPKGE